MNDTNDLGLNGVTLLDGVEFKFVRCGVLGCRSEDKKIHISATDATDINTSWVFTVSNYDETEIIEDNGEHMDIVLLALLNNNNVKKRELCFIDDAKETRNEKGEIQDSLADKIFEAEGYNKEDDDHPYFINYKKKLYDDEEIYRIVVINTLTKDIFLHEFEVDNEGEQRYVRSCLDLKLHQALHRKLREIKLI